MKLITFIFLFIFTATAFGQDIRDRLFGEVDKILVTTEQENASLLSPGFYKEGMDYYTDAEQSLKKGDDLEDIREKISKAIYYLNKSVETSKISRELFANTLKARNDATETNAPEHSPETWEQAEDKLNNAALEVENEDITDAEEYSFDAEKLYRSAELDAIKVLYLNATWELIKKAEDEDVESYSPKSLANSKKLIDYAEKELNENRYDNDYARSLASDALSEVKHALNLTELFKKMDEDDLVREDLVLLYEKPLTEIADKFELIPKYDNGYDSLKNQILAKVDEFYILKRDYADMQQQLKQYKAELEAVAMEKAEIGEKLGKIEVYMRKYNEIKGMFSASQASVLRNENNIIIRLSSIRFSTGSSVLNPKYFELLTRVQQAIKKFPDATVIVEGHTDSHGTSEKNLQLSQSRADAVFKYLFANLGFSRNKMFAVGYGETRPIATNKTEAGRVKNRRIDVVIKPFEE